MNASPPEPGSRSCSLRWLAGALGASLLGALATPGNPAVARQPVAAGPVAYRVRQLDARARTVRVECSPGVTGEVTFSLPRWIPGAYERFPIRRFVSDVRLTGERVGELPLVEEAASWSWRASIPAGERATLSYTVRGSENESTRGLMQLYVGRDTAFLLPAACMVYVRGGLTRPCRLELSLPAGWQAAVPLEPAAEGFLAKDFEELGDSPVEMGRRGPGGLAVLEGQAAGRLLRLAVAGRPAAGERTMRGVAELALDASATLFADTLIPDYTMGLHAGRGASNTLAGLEHARASTMAFDSASPLSDENLRGMGASLVFHEAFHAWNVKAMRPSELVPYRFDRLPRVPTLWFAEGFANYYGSLMPVRAGWWKEPRLLYEDLGDHYTRYAHSAGRLRTSLVKASEITFEDRVYGEGDGTSYYTKGMLVALLLDLDLRRATRGARTLDNVMRWVYRRYPASRGGYPPNFLPGAIRAAAGVDLDREYRAYVETAEDLPFGDRLRVVGLRLTSDQGSWRVSEDPEAPPEARRMRQVWLHGAPKADSRELLPRTLFRAAR